MIQIIVHFYRITDIRLFNFEGGLPWGRGSALGGGGVCLGRGVCIGREEGLPWEGRREGSAYLGRAPRKADPPRKVDHQEG